MTLERVHPLEESTESRPAVTNTNMIAYLKQLSLRQLKYETAVRLPQLDIFFSSTMIVVVREDVTTTILEQTKGSACRECRRNFILDACSAFLDEKGFSDNSCNPPPPPTF